MNEAYIELIEGVPETVRGWVRMHIAEGVVTFFFKDELGEESVVLYNLAVIKTVSTMKVEE